MKIKISEIANLPSKWGNFQIQSFKENDKEHLCIFKNTPKDTLNLRIHSECLTGDALGSLKCDCGEQLEFSLKYIEKNGGMVIYLRQEGRGIGLLTRLMLMLYKIKVLIRLKQIISLALKPMRELMKL